jgi:hypothetical protein
VRGGVVALGQKQVAVDIASAGIEQGKFGLQVLLPPLGVGERLLGLLPPTDGAQGVGKGRPSCHHLKFVAAAVSMGVGSLGRRQPRSDLAGQQFCFAEVGGADRSVMPVPGVLGHPQPHTVGRQRLREPPLRAQLIRRLA